jgi:murein DD-endopeptidase MepM/ murein hydrolase activator NlpD
MARAALTLLLLAGGCAAPQAESYVSTIRELPPGAEVCAPLAWPVDAPISSPFGPRDGHPHLGLDLGAPEGTPVHAACAGVVRYAGEGRRGYGRLIVIEHAGGLSTAYAHNRALEVGVGAVVARGQRIARSGATGHVTAPHLHFEVRRAGVAVDPAGLLGPRPIPPGIGYARSSP